MINTAVILAGGLGSRLKPFTDIIPKPLLPIGEKSVLEIQIAKLKASGIERVVLATNHKSAYIEKFFGDGSALGVELIISKEQQKLGTAGPVRLAREYLGDDFIVMNGDVLCDIDYGNLVKTARNINASLTVGVKQVSVPFQFGNIEDDGTYIVGVEEKPDLSFNIVAGIYYMTDDIFQFIPENRRFDMDELINTMLSSRARIGKYQIPGYWLDIGREEDYRKAQKYYKR